MNIFEEKLQKLMGKEGWWTVPFDQVWALANAEAEKGRLEKRWNGDTGHIEFRTTTVGDELEKLRRDCGILLAMIDSVREVTGEGPEGEDAILVEQIREGLRK